MQSIRLHLSLSSGIAIKAYRLKDISYHYKRIAIGKCLVGKTNLRLRRYKIASNPIKGLNSQRN